MASEKEDKIVAQLDVQLCNTTLGNSTQLCLFQYPLRPTWRPYGFDGTSKLQLKPEAGRVEMTIPLDTRCENYNAEAASELQLDSITLRSSPAALPSSVAMATVRGGRLLLLPVNKAFSFRPDMSHLDEPVEQPAKQEDQKDAVGSKETKTIKPQFQRRETERQTKARLNSYAHLSKLEKDEAWVEMEITNQAVADVVLSKLAAGPRAPLPMSLSRQEYLAALLPRETTADAAEPAAASGERAGRHQKPSGPQAGPSSAAGHARGVEEVVPVGPPLPPEQAAALERSLGDLFRSHPVADLRGIKHWLGEARDAGQLEALVAGPDAALRSAVLQSGLARLLPGCYVSTKSGSPEADALRKVVLDILARQPSLKKQEVMKAAQEASLRPSEAHVTRALKEVCQSRGANWALKKVYSGSQG